MNALVPIYAGRADRKPTVVGHAIVGRSDYVRLSRYRWTLDSYGYVVRRPPRPHNIRIPMHREVLGFAHGDGRVADHINRNKLDNRRSNLREVTRAQNNQNRDAYRNGRSRFRGVSWDGTRGLWRATGCVGGQWKQIGRFSTEEEAAAAAAAWRRQHMPFSYEEVAA